MSDIIRNINNVQKLGVNMKNRLEFIDLTKLIAIILIVISHSGCLNDYTNILINSFYITVFFVCTGYTINLDKANDKKHLLEKIKKILKYYFFYSVIILIFYCCLQVVQGSFNIDVIKNGVIGIFYSRYYLFNSDTIIMGIGNAPMWFLTCYLLSYSLFCLLKKYIKNKDLIIAITLLLLGYILSLFKGLLPWGIDIVPYMTFFIYLGSFIKKRDLLNNIDKIGVILLMIVLLLLAYYNTTINMSLKIYGINYFYTLLMSIIGSILLMYLSKIISNNNIIKKISEYGKYTIDIMCYHLMIIFFVKYFISNQLLITAVTVVITIFISKYVNVIVKKIIK